MSHARYRPPDHSKGDESTIAGYAAVHDRPAAFEGSDGFSYSVELMVEKTPDPETPWSAFILFVKWSRIGAQTPEGHLESDYLAHGLTEADALRALGAMPIGDVKDVLDLEDSERAVPQQLWRPMTTLRSELPLDDALTVMRRAATHLAQVADASGKVLGLVALEDVLELLVGEVTDPAHREVPEVKVTEPRASGEPEQALAG